MRVIKIILIVLLVVITLAVIGGIVFLKTFDINRYKPQLISLAQSSLNRKLDFSNIDLNVSLAQGVRVAVRDIVLGEHPAFGSGEFLTVEEAYLGIDVLAFALKRQVAISKVLIKTPRVTIIRALDGALNAQSLAAPEDSTGTAQKTSEESSQTSPPSALPAVFVQTVELQNGTVKYIDQTFESPLDLEIKQLRIGVNGFSLNAPFPFSVSGSVFGPDENFRVEGRARIDPRTFEIKLSQVKSVTDFQKFTLKDIRQLPILPQDTPFPEVLEGILTVSVKELSAGAEGLKSINADLQLDGMNITIKELAPGLSFAASKINAGVKDFSLGAPFQWNITAAYLSSEQNLSASGKASVDMNTLAVKVSDTQVSADLGSFSLEQLKASSGSLLKEVPLPDKMAGKLQIKIKEAGVSPQGLDALKMDAGLVDAQVVMKEIAPGISIDARHIDLALRDFSLNEPFGFSLKTAYLSTAQNIFLEGRGSFDLDTQTISLMNTNLKTDLSALILTQIKETLAILKDAPLPDELAGMLLFNIKEAGVTPAGLIRLVMDVQVSDGNVVIKELAPGVGFKASRMNVSLKNFSLNDVFDIKGSLAYLNDEPNISFQGNGSFDMTAQQVKLNGFELKTELSSFSLDRLRETVAAVKDAPLPQSMKGTVNVLFSSLTAGPAGLTALNGSADILNGQIKLKELAAPVDELTVKIGLNEKNINLRPSGLRVGQGKINAEGNLDNYLTARNYQLNTKLDSLSVIELVDQTDFPVKIHGLISGGLNLSGQGFDPVKMLDALKGQGQFDILEGKLTDINILKLVLDQLNFIPNLRQTLEDNLPPRFKEKLKQKDTIVTAVTMNVGIENSAVLLNSMDMEADGFFFRGKGKAGFDQSFAFEGSFIIPQDMAQSMAKVSSEFELLYNDQGQIQFPLKVSGKGAAVKFAPDLKYITTNVMKNKGRQELQKVFDKVLDKNKPSAENDPAQLDPDEPVQPKPKSPEQMLIEGVLDSIFK